MRKRALQVALHARELSVVELTVAERVQLDRITPSPHGCVAERRGALLEPGAHTLALAKGHYFFKTLSDASFHVVRGAIEATRTANDKDRGWPDAAIPDLKGDEAPGDLPHFTIE